MLSTDVAVDNRTDYYSKVQTDFLVRETAKKSLYFFSKHILFYDLLNEDNEEWCQGLQDEFIRVLSMPKGEIIHHIQDIITNYMRLYPRETFKSTVFSVALPMWLLVNFPDLSILLGSKANSRSIGFLSEIKNHYESNTKFRYYFGDWVGAVWQDSAIVVSRRTRLGVKEPSIMAVGIKTTLTSVHFDVAILDDVVGPEDRDSAAERERSKLFLQDMTDLVRRGGITLLVGTHWHYQDAYAKIKKQDKKHLQEANKHLWDIDSRSCWDENHKPLYKVFSSDFLRDRLLKKGSVVFAANYENKPKPSDTEIFNLDKMTFFSMDDINWKTMPKLGYNDPAVGKSKSACYAPIITAAVDYSGKVPILYIIDADVKRRPASRIVDDIQEKHELFGYHRFRMESVAMQEFLREKTEENSMRIAKEKVAKMDIPDEKVDDELLNQAYAVGLPIEPDDKLQGSKESRIEALEYPIDAGYIRFREDWLTAPSGYSEGIDQLIEYPIHQFRDFPDCLAGLWRMTRVNAGYLV